MLKLICTLSQNFANKNLVLLGDFNLGQINWDNWTSASGPKATDTQLLECLRQNLLVQHVKFPTRARNNNTPHILDLIITNSDFISDIENNSPLGKSDHSVLNFAVNVDYNCPVMVPKFRYEKGNYEDMKRLLPCL
jgi:hypothetical protein